MWWSTTDKPIKSWRPLARPPRPARSVTARSLFRRSSTRFASGRAKPTKTHSEANRKREKRRDLPSRVRVLGSGGIDTGGEDNETSIGLGNRALRRRLDHPRCDARGCADTITSDRCGRYRLDDFSDGPRADDEHTRPRTVLLRHGAEEERARHHGANSGLHVRVLDPLGSCRIHSRLWCGPVYFRSSRSNPPSTGI